MPKLIRKLSEAEIRNAKHKEKPYKLTGVDRSDMYNRPILCRRLEKAIEMGFEELEDDMHRRAFEGVLTTNQHGTSRKYSEVLAMFLLKAYRPDKYSDRYRSAISRAEKITLDLDDPRIANKIDSILRSLMVSAQNSPSRKVSTEL